MIRIKGLAGAIAMAAVLTGGAMASPVLAAEPTQVETRTLGAALNTSLIMARQIDREMMERGLPLSDSMRQRLTLMDRELDVARVLTRDPVMEQGIHNVRQAVQKVAANDPDMVALVNESVIELYALRINATMMEGIDRLEQAVTALEQGDRQVAARRLQEAGHLLDTAQDMGGYHIQNDLDAIQVLLLGLSDTAAPVSRDQVAERVMEVREHLFSMGLNS